jgi:hypothetical protein
LLVALGLLLAASTVAGYAWALASELGTVCSALTESGEDVASDCIEAIGGTRRPIRLGHAGLVAAALGWAGLGRTAISAALRVPLALVVLPVVLGLLLYGGSELVSAIRESSRADEFKPVNEFSVEPSLSIDPSDLFVVIGFVVGSALLGLLSRASVDRSGGLRPWTAGLLLAGFVAEAARNLATGAEVASALTVLSALWLLAVLRLASRRAGERQGGGLARGAVRHRLDSPSWTTSTARTSSSTTSGRETGRSWTRPICVPTTRTRRAATSSR